MIPVLPALPAAVAPPWSALTFPGFAACGAELFLQREDLRDPLLGGNKWFKLSGHLTAARAQEAQGVLSFGGAWSNHLHALAACGARYGFATYGLVRGERETAMLADCRRWGMNIQPLSFTDYRRRHDADFLQALQARHDGMYLLPEGGGGEAGLLGFKALVQELLTRGLRAGDVVAVAMGTGTTAAGLARYLPADVSLWGIPVLPLPGIEQKLAQWTPNFRVWHGLVDQGYARLSPELEAFMQQVEYQQGVVLDPIYTVKLLWALEILAKTQRIPCHSRVIALHSGGLQGRRGFDLGWSARVA